MHPHSGHSIFCCISSNALAGKFIKLFPVELLKSNLNLISNIPGNNIPNGIYYFFIRYEITKDTYTAWFPIGIPHYAINSRNKTIIDHYYDINDYSAKHRTTTYAKYNDVNNIINKAANARYGLAVGSGKRASTRMPFGELT